MNTISLALAMTLLSAGAAAAQTSPCRGSVAADAVVHGPVLHVIDGQTLCVATGADPSQWAPVKLADAPSDAAWGALMGVAFGKNVTCAAGVCRIDGRSVGAQLGQADAAKAGVVWRRSADEAGKAPADIPMRIAAAGS